MFGSGEDTDYFQYEAPQPRVGKSIVVSEMRLKLYLIGNPYRKKKRRKVCGEDSQGETVLEQRGPKQSVMWNKKNTSYLLLD